MKWSIRRAERQSCRARDFREACPGSKTCRLRLQQLRDAPKEVELVGAMTVRPAWGRRTAAPGSESRQGRGYGSSKAGTAGRPPSGSFAASLGWFREAELLLQQAGDTWGVAIAVNGIGAGLAETGGQRVTCPSSRNRAGAPQDQRVEIVHVIPKSVGRREPRPRERSLMSLLGQECADLAQNVIRNRATVGCADSEA